MRSALGNPKGCICNNVRLRALGPTQREGRYDWGSSPEGGNLPEPQVPAVAAPAPRHFWLVQATPSHLCLQMDSQPWSSPPHNLFPPLPKPYQDLLPLKGELGYVAQKAKK